MGRLSEHERAQFRTFERITEAKPGDEIVYFTGGSLGQVTDDSGRASKKYDPAVDGARKAAWSAYERGLCSLAQRRRSWGRTYQNGDMWVCNAGSEFDYIAVRK